MRNMLRWVFLLTAALLLAGLLLPVFAAEGESPATAQQTDPPPAPTPSSDAAPDPTSAPPASSEPVPLPTEEEKPPAPEPIRLDPFDAGPEPPPVKEADIERTEGGLHYEIPEDWTAQDVVAWFIRRYDLDADCFAVSFYCPATGERADWNEDAYFIAASTYKLPLNMYYYEQEAAGVYSPNTMIAGTPLSLAHQQSLLWSMNEISLEMVYNLGPFYVYKRLVTERYGTLPEEDYPLAYWGNNYYSTRFMVDTLTYLYDRQEAFPELLDYLLQAMPGYFLQKYNADVPVAHKYGMVDANFHDVGILYTAEPCLVAIYTHDYQRSVYGEELIARLGKAFLDYQTQRTELNRLAAEQTEPAETETEAPATETDAPVTESNAPARETEVPAPETGAPASAAAEQTEAAVRTTEDAAGQPSGASEPEAKSSPVLPILLILLGAGAAAAGVAALLRTKKK